MADPKDVDVTVRAAEAADVEALADLMTQLGYETRGSEMQMRMEAIRGDKHYATLVAVSKGQVCGMIGTFTCYSYEHNSPGGRILALVVSEKMRGRGVGHALIAAAEKYFTRRSEHAIRAQRSARVLREGRLQAQRLPICKGTADAGGLVRAGWAFPRRTRISRRAASDS